MPNPTNEHRRTGSNKEHCEVHESDGKVTETFISEPGFPHDLTHCSACGIAMSKPVSLTIEPDRFQQFATSEALDYLRKLGLLAPED